MDKKVLLMIWKRLKNAKQNFQKNFIGKYINKVLNYIN